MLGAGLEPACLSAYAPQTYVSAIPPPERDEAKIENGRWETGSRKGFFLSFMLMLLLVIESNDGGVNSGEHFIRFNAVKSCHPRNSRHPRLDSC